ncbi:MAG: hypothetical protein KME16_02145 [Scytolyngbya sp. HA4215-MV1]|jgi:hypothetical protein|nr:hypothetical protein [Scytolyngbya sp. HA4215-MV1]
MSRNRPAVKEIYFSKARCENPSDQEGIEKNFFFSLVLKNGVSKTTYANRFNDLNELINSILPQNYPLQLMDVAVSSGISTIEWIESLRMAGINHHMVAGDLTIKAYLVTILKYLHILVDKTGYPLQFDIADIAIPASPRSFFLFAMLYPCRVVGSIVSKFILYFLTSNKDFELYDSNPDKKSFLISCCPLYLVSPRLKKEPGLTIIEDDILLNDDPSLEKRFHLIRATNILNKTYFDQKTILRALDNLHSRLVDHGVLVVCRTEDNGINHGTIFKLNANRRFEIEKRLGKGSEIEDLVLEIRPKFNH